MTAAQTELLDALSGALFGSSPAAPLSKDTREEAIRQSVYPLVAEDASAFQYIGNNVRVCYEQQNVAAALKGIPFVVLKGLAAAIHYPDPLRRTLGDIDIIAAPADFARACSALLSAGFKTGDPLDGDERHIHFRHHGVTVELHRRFAECNTKEQEELLDGWIYDALAAPVIGRVDAYSFPMMPDELNGLVLLNHVSQHLEEGLGLRQILDWVMYVDKKLPDERWESFREKTDRLGLTTLAVASARIGQLYLHAYPELQWCAQEDALAAELLAYVFFCGNFGTKLGKNAPVTMVMSQGKGGVFTHLQKRGEANWKALERHPGLKPFAWAYQAGRYASRGLKQGISAADWKNNLDASRKRNDLIERLGARQLSLREKE